MPDNMIVYDAVRAVPNAAKRSITAGRLKGKTDINPMWRIKVLTEQFGVCGFGWKYEILSERLETGANNEISAFVTIHLYVKIGDAWSAPIPGVGGSAFVAKERSGLYTSDECFKMALTDAISVACKALGVGADVYWDADASKYTNPNAQPAMPSSATQQQIIQCQKCGKPIQGTIGTDGRQYSAVDVYKQCRGMCPDCYKAVREAAKAQQAAKQTEAAT